MSMANTRFYSFLLLVAVSVLGTTACMAQEKAEASSKTEARGQKTDEFCSNWSWGDRANFNEVRDYTIASTGSINVDPGMNGGVSVIGEDRGDILIRACVQAQAKTAEEAQALARGITIRTGSVISVEGPSDAQKGWGENKGWGVSFRIHVPRNTNLKLKAYNGGIKISGVDSTMEFEALNGGVKLSDVAGNVRGRTTNGGIKVDLSGSTWKGAGLDVQTTNGGVHVTMPRNYAAHFETGTVNGGFKSDIEGLTLPEDNQRSRGHRASRISTDLNGGGAPIRLITTNGGVKITTPDE